MFESCRAHRSSSFEAHAARRTTRPSSPRRRPDVQSSVRPSWAMNTSSARIFFAAARVAAASRNRCGSASQTGCVCQPEASTASAVTVTGTGREPRGAIAMRTVQEVRDRSTISSLWPRAAMWARSPAPPSTTSGRGSSRVGSTRRRRRAANRRQGCASAPRAIPPLTVGPASDAITVRAHRLSFGAQRAPVLHNRLVPLYLTEQDVAELLTPADAVEAIEACFRRMAAGSVENRPRYRLGLDGGSARGHGRRRPRARLRGREGLRRLPRRRALRRAPLPRRLARARRGASRRTSSASCAPVRRAASRRSTSPRAGASSLGVIGCGWQAESQVAVHPRRAAAGSSASSPTAGPRNGCAPSARSTAPSRARATRIPPPATSSSPRPRRAIPVLRGEWLAAGRARLRGRCERRPPPRARQRRPRARRLRLLRLGRRREARVRRPDRADRVGRPRLARGARAAGGRRGRGGGPPVGRGHRRLQVQRARRVGRRRSGGRRRPRAGGGCRPRGGIVQA